MKHAYKLFAAAIVLVAMVFGSMEVAYRSAEVPPPQSGSAAPKSAQRPANTPKPVIIPAPNARPELGEPPNPGVQPVIELPRDEAPPPDVPAVSGESQAPAPMVIIPAQDG